MLWNILSHTLSQAWSNLYNKIKQTTFSESRNCYKKRSAVIGNEQMTVSISNVCFDLPGQDFIIPEKKLTIMPEKILLVSMAVKISKQSTQYRYIHNTMNKNPEGDLSHFVHYPSWIDRLTSCVHTWRHRSQVKMTNAKQWTKWGRFIQITTPISLQRAPGHCNFQHLWYNVIGSLLPYTVFFHPGLSL